MAVKTIRPPAPEDWTLFLRTLFLRTERQIVDEITRKRAGGYVDYAEVAALERVQKILQNMTDESWEYHADDLLEKRPAALPAPLKLGEHRLLIKI